MRSVGCLFSLLVCSWLVDWLVESLGLLFSWPVGQLVPLLGGRLVVRQEGSGGWLRSLFALLVRWYVDWWSVAVDNHVGLLVDRVDCLIGCVS